MFLRITKRGENGRVVGGEVLILEVIKRHPDFLRDLAANDIELVFTDLPLNPEVLAAATETKNARS